MADIYFLNREPIRKVGTKLFMSNLWLLHNIDSWYLRFLQYIQRARSYSQRNFRYVRDNRTRALFIKPKALGFAIEFQQELHQYTLQTTHISVPYSKCMLELTCWRVPIFSEVPYRLIPMCLRRNTHILNEHKSQTHHLLRFLIIFIDSRYFEPVSFFPNVL